MPYYVYILPGSYQNKLYIGQTKSLEERIKRHKTQQGARFVKSNKDFQLVYSEIHSSQLLAMRREKQLKGWTRVKKEALITGDLKLLKEL